VGVRFTLDAEITRAGRHPESDIFLDDITVSRRHAEFVTTGVTTVRDVGSLNGTYVNRERIEEAVLSSGDEVQIGKFKLLYLVATANERRERSPGMAGGR
jgi:pSer/pThr/pTyr-binding forkhead associated (FHA) protein